MSVAAFLSSIPETESVGDPSATRTVYITVVLLLVLGVALAVLAVWLWRRTRPEPQLLAPLEEMQTRAWRKQDPAGQRRALDASRPPGALPVHREAAEPVLDAEFESTPPVVGFDDLANDSSANAPTGDDSTEPADDDEAAELAPGEPDAVAADEGEAEGTDDDSDDADAADPGEGDDAADPDHDDDDTAEQSMPEQDLLGGPSRG